MSLSEEQVAEARARTIVSEITLRQMAATYSMWADAAPSVVMTVKERDALCAVWDEAKRLRAALEVAREELDHWGHGDMHYGNMPRHPRVVAALAAIDAALVPSVPATEPPRRIECDPREVAAILREQLRVSGMSQKELAVAADVTEGRISQILSGDENVTLKTLRWVQDALTPSVPATDRENCPTCDGEGWYADHSDECYAAGYCVGCGGVQRQCDNYAFHVSSVPASTPEDAT